MATGADPLQFVLSSSVRSDVLLAIADGSRTTDELLDALDASSSAVYNALGRLEDAGLIASADGAWTPTGSGRLIADFVRERERLGALLGEASEYFATHDARAIPAEFRLRMSELAGATVITAPETEPQGVVREVSDRIADADAALMIAPIYDELFEGAMPDSEGTRLVLDEGIVEMAVEDADDPAAIEAELSSYADDDIRVADVRFALTVTDAALLLSLPPLDGGYDARSEFVVEHERGRAWGRELFEAVWAEAVPVEEHVVDTYL